MTAHEFALWRKAALACVRGNRNVSYPDEVVGYLRTIDSTLTRPERDFWEEAIVEACACTSFISPLRVANLWLAAYRQAAQARDASHAQGSGS